NYTGRNTSFFANGIHVPYVMNWSGGLQIDLGRDWVYEMLYQGSSGVGITGGININQLSQAIYDSTDVTLLNAVRTAPQNYRPNQISQNVMTDNWSIGPNRFPTSAQNPLFIQDAFAYPAAYRAGTLGAGTAYGLWQYWPQWTLSKTFTIRERVKFSVRLDGNNIPVK